VISLYNRRFPLTRAKQKTTNWVNPGEAQRAGEISSWYKQKEQKLQAVVPPENKIGMVL
jgi:hypothetical protein